MTDRRHFLKRGDRPTKKERQTTASGLEKSDKLRFVLWVKSDSDMYYNKTSDKAATKLVVGLINVMCLGVLFDCLLIYILRYVYTLHLSATIRILAYEN